MGSRACQCRLGRSIGQAQLCALQPRAWPPSRGRLRRSFSRLENAGRLRRDSAYVKAAQSALRGYMQDRIAVDPDSLAATARTEDEKELGDALRLSLGVKVPAATQQ